MTTVHPESVLALDFWEWPLDNGMFRRRAGEVTYRHAVDVG